MIYIHDFFFFSFSYPTKYIYRQFMTFFEKYSLISTSIIPMIHDENEYEFICRQLIDQTSIPEHQGAARLAQMFDYNNIPWEHPPISEREIIETEGKRQRDLSPFYL